MKHNKTGTIFMVSILALAGIGISYAGFSDSISVYGTVDTATVNLEVMNWYSGTDVWKVYDDPLIPGVPAVIPKGEIVIWSGFLNDPARPSETSLEIQYPGCAAERISWSFAGPGAYTFPDGTDSDVDMVYHNLFPCIDFSADFIFHYTGTIPAKIDTAQIFPILYDINYPDSEELAALWGIYQSNPSAGFGMHVEAYRCFPIYGTDGVTIVGWTIDTAQLVDVGYQLHNCNYVYVKLVIHLPQDNIWQGLHGAFGGKIGVIQWNDACGIT